jgi:hypothetical protein
VRHRALAAAAVALASAAAACLPIPHWETASPRLVGRLTREDGTPVAGARVAATGDGTDTRCARARRQAVTDADGRFELPRTRSFHPVVVMFGDWTHGYHVCGGEGPALEEAYRYFGLAPPPRQDTLACVRKREGPVTCATPRERRRGS